MLLSSLHGTHTLLAGSSKYAMQHTGLNGPGTPLAGSSKRARNGLDGTGVRCAVSLKRATQSIWTGQVLCLRAASNVPRTRLHGPGAQFASSLKNASHGFAKDKCFVCWQLQRCHTGRALPLPSRGHCVHNTVHSEQGMQTMAEQPSCSQNCSSCLPPKHQSS